MNLSEVDYRRLSPNYFQMPKGFGDELIEALRRGLEAEGGNAVIFYDYGDPYFGEDRAAFHAFYFPNYPLSNECIQKRFTARASGDGLSEGEVTDCVSRVLAEMGL
jgi:hypothetical protein